MKKTSQPYTKSYYKPNCLAMLWRLAYMLQLSKGCLKLKMTTTWKKLPYKATNYRLIFKLNSNKKYLSKLAVKCWRWLCLVSGSDRCIHIFRLLSVLAKVKSSIKHYYSYSTIWFATGHPKRVTSAKRRPGNWSLLLGTKSLCISLHLLLQKQV